MGVFKVRVNGKYMRLKLKKGMNVLDVMHRLGVNRETHLARKNGRLVSELEKIGSRDKVEIFGVVYGG